MFGLRPPRRFGYGGREVDVSGKAGDGGGRPTNHAHDYDILKEYDFGQSYMIVRIPADFLGEGKIKIPSMIPMMRLHLL